MPETTYRISELTAISTINNGDLIEVSNVDANSESGYASRKATMTDLGDKLNNGIQYSTELNTTDKKVIGAINEVAGKWLSSTLAASATSLVFTDNAITANSKIEVYADDGNLYYTSIAVDGANHTCTIGFPAQSSAVVVDLWVR